MLNKAQRRREAACHGNEWPRGFASCAKLDVPNVGGAMYESQTDVIDMTGFDEGAMLFNYWTVKDGHALRVGQ